MPIHARHWRLDQVGRGVVQHYQHDQRLHHVRIPHGTATSARQSIRPVCRIAVNSTILVAGRSAPGRNGDHLHDRAEQLRERRETHLHGPGAEVQREGGDEVVAGRRHRRRGDGFFLREVERLEQPVTGVLLSRIRGRHGSGLRRIRGESNT